MSTLIVVLAFVSALGSGLVAGVFFAFSTFVMRALARLSPAEGIRAMQHINDEQPPQELQLARQRQLRWVGRVRVPAGLVCAGGVRNVNLTGEIRVALTNCTLTAATALTALPSRS